MLDRFTVPGTMAVAAVVTVVARASRLDCSPASRMASRGVVACATPAVAVADPAIASAARRATDARRTTPDMG